MKNLIFVFIVLICSCRATDLNYGYQKVPVRDYQLEVIEDSILIFDGKKHVKTIPFEMEHPVTALDIAISEDNH